MSVTPSTMLPLGTAMPDAVLPDTVSGQQRSLHALRGEQGTLVVFICNHCPFVKHIESGLLRFAHDYLPRGLAIIAISSNDAEQYPQDGPAAMQEHARVKGYPFPYLYDESQQVARAFQAACTPDWYLFDGASRLVYRGQFDGSRPGNAVPVTGADLRAATDQLLVGRSIDVDQKPSAGCNIKWRHK